MGTEVLRPQDCLIERIRAPAVFHQRRRNFNVNGNGSASPRVTGRRSAPRPEQKKRTENAGPVTSRKPASLDNVNMGRRAQNINGHLVMGQVTILRRGESLDSLDSKIADGVRRHKHRPAKKAADDLALCGTERLGPGPETVPKQIRIGDLKSALVFRPVNSGDRPDIYAGSAFSMSPSPSSLPLPSFFHKTQKSKLVVEDSATRNLRRLLRLD